MDITAILMNNFTTLCLVFGMIILTLAGKGLDKKTNLTFFCFAALVLVLNCMDMVDYYLSGLNTLSPLRYITSAMGYSLRPLTMAVIIRILLRRNHVGFLLWLPVVLLALLAFTSPFTHWMFWFDSSNGYFNRGPLGYASHILSGIYLAVLLGASIKLYRNMASGEVFAILYIAVICVLATVLESLFSYKFLLDGAMITSCALYYIFLYVQTYKQDFLTGLQNRRSFYTDMEAMRNQEFWVIAIDLNELKTINDTRGHDAGDRALQALSAVLTKQCKRGFRAYRTGGDEFAVLCRGEAAPPEETYIASARAALEKAGLTASFGSALHRPGDSPDDICNQADASMYTDKQHYKHRTTQR